MFIKLKLLCTQEGWKLATEVARTARPQLNERANMRKVNLALLLSWGLAQIIKGNKKRGYFIDLK